MFTFDRVDHVGHSSSQQRSVLKTAETPPSLDSPNVYTGGCHCGALTLRLRSTPLDRTYEGLVLECNCRVCEMVSFISQMNLFWWLANAIEERLGMGIP